MDIKASVAEASAARNNPALLIFGGANSYQYLVLIARKTTTLQGVVHRARRLICGVLVVLLPCKSPSLGGWRHRACIFFFLATGTGSQKGCSRLASTLLIIAHALNPNPSANRFYMRTRLGVDVGDAILPRPPV